jgi:3-methyladenine DNA glycosylase AlkD
MTCNEIIIAIRALGNPDSLAEIQRVGIPTENALGVSLWKLRRMAKQIGTDHALALELWATGLLEARLLATMVEDPEQLTDEQVEAWALDLDCWAVCDQFATDLLDRTPFAIPKAYAWSEREEEFVKRAGYAIMAALAVHDKALANEEFIRFLEPIRREATDDRNFVKKAVNWALRNIGKRNRALNAAAIEAAREIDLIDSRAAHWIAKDALRELTGEKLRIRLKAPRPPKPISVGPPKVAVEVEESVPDEGAEESPVDGA